MLPDLQARDYPPDVLPPKPIVIPNTAVHTLPNGLQVVIVERHTLPLVTLRLVVKSGAECDPPNLPGTATLVNGLLSEGTERRSAREIAQTVDSIGGVVDNDVDWDSSYLSLSVLTDRTDLAFDLVSDMTIRPAFRPEEIERQRKQVLSGLKVSLGDPAYVADTAFQNLIFAGTAYGHSEDGTEASAERINASDILPSTVLTINPRIPSWPSWVISPHRMPWCWRQSTSPNGRIVLSHPL